MSRLFAYIEKLVAQKFFGTLSLSFQNGKLCGIKIEKRMSPDDLPVP